MVGQQKRVIPIENCEAYRRYVENAEASYVLDCPGRLTAVTTQAVHFEKQLKTKEPLTLQNLRELSNTRGSITASVLKYSKDGEYSTLEDAYRWQSTYLPILFNFVEKQGQISVPKCKKFVFKWSSYAETISKGGRQFFDLEDVRHELAMSLALHAAVLQEMGCRKAELSKVDERAREQMHTSTSTTQQDDVAMSATLLRRAAGVYSFLSSDSGLTEGSHSNLLQQLKAEKLLPAYRPAELSQAVAKAFSLIALGDAQSLTAGRCEMKTGAALLSMQSGGGDGRPQVVSFGTVAALYRAASNLYDEAAGTIKANRGEFNQIRSELLDFIAVCQQLALARCFRCMGFQKREDCEAGEAIRFVETALQALAFCKRVSVKRPRWLETLQAEERVATELLHKVKIENQVVYFQKTDVPIAAPTEKVLVSGIAFEPQVARQNLFVEQ